MNDTLLLLGSDLHGSSHAVETQQGILLPGLVPLVPQFLELFGRKLAEDPSASVSPLASVFSLDSVCEYTPTTN